MGKLFHNALKQRASPNPSMLHSFLSEKSLPLHPCFQCIRNVDFQIFISLCMTERYTRLYFPELFSANPFTLPRF